MNDGWVEQGGFDRHYRNDAASTYSFTITLLKPMADTNYYFNYLLITGWQESFITLITKSTTNVQVIIYGGHEMGKWEVKGIGA